MMKRRLLRVQKSFFNILNFKNLKIKKTLERLRLN